jgi:AcrR family transcriptional regulator
MKREELSTRTKEELALSLGVLLQKKDLKKITITDLITECNVSRPTFYYHFKGINDLMKWSFEYSILKSIREIPEDKPWRVGLTLLLEHLHNNRESIVMVYQSLGLSEIHSIFSTEIHDLMHSFSSKIMGKTPHSPKENNFILEFYSHALAITIVDWVINDTKQSIDDLLNLIELAITGQANNQAGT